MGVQAFELTILSSVHRTTEMDIKYNCWEYMKCGKGPDENKTDPSRTCPAAANNVSDGLNGGRNGGRICWLIAETKCCGEVEHANQNRKNPCFSCGFRFKVMAEEGLVQVCNATGKFLDVLKKTNK